MALTIDVVSDVVCPWCFIGKRLERAHHLEGLAHRREREGRDDRAAIGLQRDQALRGKPLDGLPERRPRHAEPFAQHALQELRARRQLALHDHVAQALGRVLVQQSRGQRNIVHGRIVCILTIATQYANQ